ncbi:MAG: hypothetical protein KUL78_11210 [Flavobacterium sp.]|nr:hypothetical protein [Flavobacterium sp.]
MENKNLGQEPAFPIHESRVENLPTGMSKRFYAACAAMQGILSNETLRVDILKDERNGHGSIAEISFYYADELLKQENQ